MRRGLSLLIALLVALPFLAAADPAALDEHAGEDVTIVRDTYGVPHVYADTREGVSYGAGYALAQDRLWQMHLFRRIAKGRLSEILGPIVIDIDKGVRFMTYTEQERQRRLASYPEDIQRGLEAFTAGINDWIAEAQSDPSKMPFEFAEYGELPIEPWQVTDSVALSDVLILSFGAGGGNELQYAALAERLVERFGEQEGLAAFDDLIRTDDPDDPVTIPEDLDWRRTPTGARSDEAESRRALTPDARISLLAEPSAAADAGDGGALAAAGTTAGVAAGTSHAADQAVRGTRAQLALVPDAAKALDASAAVRRGIEAVQAMFSFGSNAQLVTPALSETGNTLQTGGPQVGYMVPQWLADFGLHGGGLDATGMTFAGAGPAVLIGRGNGYAWTTTTGASDLADTYVETLNPDDPRQYEFEGQWEDMECRTETYTFRGVPFDEQEVCRTRHGPVLAFDEENDVAYSLRYAWFDREGQTVEGFWRYNEAESLEDYATAASYLASNHNMFYSDDQGHSGFWHPGNHPVRAEGIDLRLPQDGTGGSEWQGLLPIDEVPHAVDFDRGWLGNWNNAPAADWHRERTYPARDNAVDLYAAYEQRDLPDPNSDGGVVNKDGLWDFEDLSANLRYAAMKDHVETWYRSALPDVDDLGSEVARLARQVIAAWDGHNLDRDGDGEYDSAGTTIVRRWVDHMHEQAFADDLEGDAGFAETDSELWHAVSPESSLEFTRDWLNGENPEDFAARTFEEAVASLAEEHGNDDPASWRSPARVQTYQRLNADLAGQLLRQGACDGGFCEGPADPRNDSGMPGDIPEHLAMDRGTYNHVIQYLEPPTSAVGEGRAFGGVGRDQTPLGEAAVRAGSVIPPGQSGFIDLAGRESDHFEDQLDLYTSWRYKPMPMSRAEADRLSESATVLTWTPPPDASHR